MSIPNSPEAVTPSNTTTSADSAEKTANEMPANTVPPVIVTTTTTAEIIDENRFSILDYDPLELPSPPKDEFYMHDTLMLNTSAGTTASRTTTPSPRSIKSHNESPHKKKHHRKNNDKNQGDLNSIESMTDQNQKIPSANMDFLEGYVPECSVSREDGGGDVSVVKNTKQKKNLDQMDGLTTKSIRSSDNLSEEDDKVVKCLYYTLMCCDCTIS